MTSNGSRFRVTTPGGFYTMDAAAIRHALSDYTGYLERETLWGLIFDKAESLPFEEVLARARQRGWTVEPR